MSKTYETCDLEIGDEVTMSFHGYLPEPWKDSTGKRYRARGVVAATGYPCGSVMIRDKDELQHWFPAQVDELIKHRVRKVRV